MNSNSYLENYEATWQLFCYLLIANFQFVFFKESGTKIE